MRQDSNYQQFDTMKKGVKKKVSTVLPQLLSHAAMCVVLPKEDTCSPVLSTQLG